eukprot:scaffold179357_cov19-Tisochrysis_lutea.AAC.1
MDGAVYEWRLKDFKREKENVLKGCNYTSVLSTPDCKTLYAAGMDEQAGLMRSYVGRNDLVYKLYCVLASNRDSAARWAADSNQVVSKFEGAPGAGAGTQIASTMTILCFCSLCAHRLRPEDQGVRRSSRCRYPDHQGSGHRRPLDTGLARWLPNSISQELLLKGPMCVKENQYPDTADKGTGVWLPKERKGKEGK